MERPKFSFSILIIPAVMLAIAAVAWPHLPEQIPVHFDLQGNPNGYGSRWVLIALSFMALGIGILLQAVPSIDPKKENYSKFGREYRLIIWASEVLMLICQLCTIGFALGYPVNIAFVISFAVGVLIAVCGNFMPRFRFNYFCGIRTPWTLASEEVWFRTHRMGGKIFYVCGLLLILLPFLPAAVQGVVLAGTILLLFVPCVYSYFLYRKLKKGLS